MTNDEIECLRQALLTMERREVRAYDVLNDPISPYSKQFERKMERLFRAERKWTWNFIKTGRRRIFCVLCALIIISIMTLSVSAIRNPLFDFVKKVFSDNINFFAQKENTPLEISKHYDVDEIPEGYTKTHERQSIGMHITEWWNGKQYISLEQGTLQGTNLNVSTKDSGGEMMFLRETEIFHITGKGTHTFIWSEDGYSFTLICPDDLPWEDIVRMIESIRPAE